MENSMEWVESVVWLLLFGVGMIFFLGGIYSMDSLLEHLALEIFRDYSLYFT